MRSDNAALQVSTLYAVDVPPAQARFAILGSKIWDWWHPSSGLGLSGSNITGWTGMFLNTAVPAIGVPNRPPYSVDGANFRGKKVMQCAATGAKFLQVDSGSDLLPLTAKITLLAVYRCRPTASGTKNLVTVASPGFTAGIELQLATSNNLRGVALNNDGTIILAGPAPDFVTHMTTVGQSGTQLVEHIDGVPAATFVATAGNYGAAMRTIAIGGYGAGALDISVAEWAVLTGLPTAAEFTALGSLFRGEWATP